MARPNRRTKDLALLDEVKGPKEGENGLGEQGMGRRKRTNLLLAIASRSALANYKDVRKSYHEMATK